MFEEPLKVVLMIIIPNPTEINPYSFQNDKNEIRKKHIKQNNFFFQKKHDKTDI